MELTLLLLLALIGLAQCFMPKTTKPKRSYTSKGLITINVPNDMAGTLGPLGVFDPLGFTTRGSAEEVKRWREAELKHGRIAMLAAAGLLAQEGDFSPSTHTQTHTHRHTHTHNTHTHAYMFAASL